MVGEMHEVQHDSDWKPQHNISIYQVSTRNRQIVSGVFWLRLLPIPKTITDTDTDT